MSDAEAPDTNPDSAEAKFVQLERELVQETSVIALMKDQMRSCLLYTSDAADD